MVQNTEKYTVITGVGSGKTLCRAWEQPNPCCPQKRQTGSFKAGNFSITSDARYCG